MSVIVAGFLAAAAGLVAAAVSYFRRAALTFTTHGLAAAAIRALTFVFLSLIVIAAFVGDTISVSTHVDYFLSLI